MRPTATSYADFLAAGDDAKPPDADAPMALAERAAGTPGRTEGSHSLRVLLASMDIVRRVAPKRDANLLGAPVNS